VLVTGAERSTTLTLIAEIRGPSGLGDALYPAATAAASFAFPIIDRESACLGVGVIPAEVALLSS